MFSIERGEGRVHRSEIRRRDTITASNAGGGDADKMGKNGDKCGGQNAPSLGGGTYMCVRGEGCAACVHSKTLNLSRRLGCWLSEITSTAGKGFFYF